MDVDCRVPLHSKTSSPRFEIHANPRDLKPQYFYSDGGRFIHSIPFFDTTIEAKLKFLKRY